MVGLQLRNLQGRRNEEIEILMTEFRVEIF